jgi:hypothetical protein
MKNNIPKKIRPEGVSAIPQYNTSLDYLPERKFPKFSVKKVLAGMGTVVIFIISLYVSFKIPEQVGNILWPLIVLISALFGIKTAGGVLINKQNGIKK